MSKTLLDVKQSAAYTAYPMMGSASGDTLDSILGKVDPELSKLFEDRNALLTRGGLITFSGTTLAFTEALVLELNSKTTGGAPIQISLGSTTRTLSATGRMVYAVLDRTLGTASVVDDATSLPTVVAANQEVFLIAKRVDAGDATQLVYFRSGMSMQAGQTLRLGAAAGTSITPISNGGTGQSTKAAAFDALSPMTTGGDIVYGGAGGTGTRLANGTSGQVLTSQGGTAAPTWTTPRPFVFPTIQKFSSGSGTYVSPSGVLYIRVRMVGGGGGGTGGSNAPGGQPTTFGSFLTANPGGGALGWGGTGYALGGDGGTVIINSPAIGVGQQGNPGDPGASGSRPGGGSGGASPFGGSGRGAAPPLNGGNAIGNSGSGGGGGGGDAGGQSGAGGGAGGYIDALVPPGTYSYSVGNGGSGTPGSGAVLGGGNGGSGYIVVEEFYQ